MNSDLNVSTYSSISHPWKAQTPAPHTYSSTADNLPNKSIIKHATIHSDSNSILGTGIHKRLLWAISGISTHIKHMYGVLHPGNTVSHPHSNPSVLHYRKQTLPAWQAFVISYLTFFFQNASLLLCQCLLLSTLRMPVCECVYVCMSAAGAGWSLQPLSCSALIDILLQQHLETGFHCRLDLEPPSHCMMTAPRTVQWAQNSQWHHPSVQQGFVFLLFWNQ